MKHRDRVLMALNHEEPDRCPMQISFTPEFASRLKSNLGLTDADMHNPHGGGNTYALERAIDEIYSQDVFDIVLDLTQVSHVSSAGWSVIVSRLSILGEKRGYFRLAGMQPDVRHVFQIVGFDRIAGIQVYATPDDAFRACRDTVLHS